MDARQPNGNPAMMFGDHVLLDNHSAHHGAAGFPLGQSLDTQGVEVVYTPVYSTELNPVEYAFNKMKKWPNKRISDQFLLETYTLAFMPA